MEREEEEINVIKETSKKEEEKYIKMKLAGDLEGRNKLIEHNLRLVAHIVKKYDSKQVQNYQSLH